MTNEMDDRAIVGRLLQRPAERPVKGTLRAILLGLVVGLILALIQLSVGLFQFGYVVGYLAAGIGIAFFEWGADRLWYSTIGAMFQHPLSWYAYLTRIPFWYMAGGIGYELAVLIGTRYGIIQIQDIPARALFSFGGRAGLVFQFVLQTHLYVSFVKTAHAE